MKGGRDDRSSYTIPPGRRGEPLRRRRAALLGLWYGEDRSAVEIAAHTCQATRVDEILDGVMEKLRRPEEGSLLRLRSDWASVVGGSFARFCEPVSFREGVLTLRVRHSALLVELKPSADLILHRVNAILGQELCCEVRFTI